MLNKKLLGSVSSAPATYVEDVFSTYLYTGTGASQSINNGIDLAGEGGLVWQKIRGTAGYDHVLTDTVTSGTGASTKFLSSNTTNSFSSNTGNIIGSYNSNGFTLNSGSGINNVSSTTAVSWTFRKQPKFFDVVTYTGDGSDTRQLAHSLGATPAFIIIKCTSDAEDWIVGARNNNNNYSNLRLNSTAASPYSFGAYPSGSAYMSSTTLGVGWWAMAGLATLNQVNASGRTYVAYLFAHNDGGFGESGTDNAISCGSFTTDGSANATVNLGYEPQWLLVKSSSGTSNWWIVDNMRGFSQTQGLNLNPNTSGAEGTTLNGLVPTATGFQSNGALDFNTTYIYMAIRRPMKVPTSGTEVFKAVKRAGTGSSTNVTAGFPVDLNITSGIEKNSEVTAPWIDRLRGSSQNFRYLWSSSTNAEAAGTASGVYELTQTGVYTYNTSYNDSTYGDNYVNWMFKRAPGFFDIVCYTGTGSATTQVHNLGVAPELIIVKLRSGGTSWPVYSANLGASNYLFLNLTSSSSTNTTIWDNTTPTASVFNIGTSSFTNSSGGTYVAYLFATCPGVSKVGSYTGNGSSQTIDCGFTAGARFVLIKDVGGGSWYVWDSARGIVAGNDPYLTLNTTNAQNYWGADDDIDPTSSGFIINNTGTNGLNISSGTYIYLAIA